MSERRHVPAYGRELLAAQKAGRNVPWLLIALDWNTGRAMPRVVVDKDVPAHACELGFVRGLDCMVAHCGEPQRALDMAEYALRAGARICSVFDTRTRRLTTTAEILAMRGRQSAA